MTAFACGVALGNTIPAIPAIAVVVPIRAVVPSAVAITVFSVVVIPGCVNHRPSGSCLDNAAMMMMLDLTSSE
jgi:hypothetical protein